MARVKLLQKDQAPTGVKEIFDKIEKNGARVLNLYRALAHNPDAMLSTLKLGNSLLTKSELSPKLRELVILRVAKLAGSDYEWAQHYPVALEAGVSREQTEAISNWQESEAFSDTERAVLKYTDEVAKNVKVPDETFDALKQYLSERNIVELTLSIAYWGLIARILVPLQVDIDVSTATSAKDLAGR